MSRGGVIAIAAAGVLAVGGLAYLIAKRKATTRPAGTGFAGGEATAPPASSPSTPETTWGGRVVAIADGVHDVANAAEGVVDRFRKYF